VNDVLVQKVTSLQRCVHRAREARERAGETFRKNFDLQDAAVLNVVRACELGIDLANMAVRQKRLGVPADARESFGLLARQGLIDGALEGRLGRMVAFRNIAVHQYRELDLAIVEQVVDRDLDDLIAFADLVRRAIDAG